MFSLARARMVRRADPRRVLRHARLHHGACTTGSTSAAPGMEFATEMIIKASLLRRPTSPRCRSRCTRTAAGAPAAPADLPRRLAHAAVLPAVQPALAVPGAGARADPARPARLRPRAARARRGRAVRPEHAAVREPGAVVRVPGGHVRDREQDVCHPRKTVCRPTRASSGFTGGSPWSASRRSGRCRLPLDCRAWPSPPTSGGESTSATSSTRHRAVGNRRRDDRPRSASRPCSAASSSASSASRTAADCAGRGGLGGRVAWWVAWRGGSSLPPPPPRRGRPRRPAGEATLRLSSRPVPRA